MGLVDLLHSVDEFTYKQFEKITIKAEKELGMDKYDLARYASNVECFTDLGFGVAMGVMGGMNGSSVTMGLGAIVAASVPIRMQRNYQEIQKIQLRDTEHMRVGTLEAPKFDALRPLIWGTAMMGMAYTCLGSPSYDLVVHVPENKEFYERLFYFGGLAFGIHYVFEQARFYFQDQLPRPPQTKKSVLQYLKEKMQPTRASEPLPIPIPIDHDN